MALAAKILITQEVEAVLRRENVRVSAGRIESKDIDLTIKLDKAYEEVDNYKNLPLKRANDGSIITLSDVSRIELGAESQQELYLKVTANKLLRLNISAVGCKYHFIINGIEKNEGRQSLPQGTTLEVSFDEVIISKQQ